MTIKPSNCLTQDYWSLLSKETNGNSCAKPFSAKTHRIFFWDIQECKAFNIQKKKYILKCNKSFKTFLTMTWNHCNKSSTWILILILHTFLYRISLEVVYMDSSITTRPTNLMFIKYTYIIQISIYIFKILG